jgi:prepilin-type N-terminal cleavage/methylation domain-containing protein/prepilin-type processing-associated H-X9-DG protein
MRKKAFTLIELLAVMSIISLFMAILMPVMTQVRRQSRTVMCLSNLRQLGMAAAAYGQIYDGYYPIAYYSREEADATVNYCWDFTIVDKSGQISIKPGLLWQDEMMEQIQQCPSFKGYSSTQYDPYTGYNYNTSYIGHGQQETIPTPARAGQIRKPANCALFGDGQWEGGANKFMRAPWPNPGDLTFSGRHSGTQGYRHDGKTNVVWCDGHAGSQKERYTDSVPQVKTKLNKYNATTKVKVGFLSPDNSAYGSE